jgi:hypothetical protein
VNRVHEPALLAALLLAVVLGATAPEANAYTGGPVRATIEGYEPVEGKLFYTLWFHDGSGGAPQVFYLHLLGPEPLAPIRARSLEHPEGKLWDGVQPQAWVNLSRRLVPLRGLS